MRDIEFEEERSEVESVSEDWQHYHRRHRRLLWAPPCCLSEAEKKVEVSNCFEAMQEEKNSEEKWVQWCGEGKREGSMDRPEYVVDSSAAESVGPLDLAD